jgi:hypothetical protein
MVERIFIDVDGVINLPLGQDSAVPCETMTVTRFTQPKPNGRRFPIEQEFSISPETIKLLQDVKAAGVEILWLTGWKTAAPETLDAIIGITSSGWVDWDIDFRDPSEKAKAEALQRFLVQHPGTTKFVWVDDIATQNPLDTSIPHLRIQTDEASGLTGKDAQAVRDFFGL